MAIAQGWQKSLAYFCHIRRLHGNGIIFDYTSRKLAKKLNKSHGTINTQVNFLIKKGLLSLVDGHLFCAGVEKMRSVVGETGKGLIKIKIHETILKTEWNLNARVAINNIKQQKFAAQITSEDNAICKKIQTNSYVSLKELKRYKARQFKSAIKPEKGTGAEKCLLSDSTIGKLLNGKSVSNVRAMMDFWKQQGLLETTYIKGRTLDTHVSLLSYWNIVTYRKQSKATYWYKGRVMETNQRSLSFGTTLTRCDSLTCI